MPFLYRIWGLNKAKSHFLLSFLDTRYSKKYICKMNIYYVDSFTNKPFRGNPAAVILTDGSLPDELMLSLAQEIGFSESAFLDMRCENGVYNLRWFTPEVEVKLCGHATLATAKVFFDKLFPSADRVVFNTKYGLLTCSKEGAGIRVDFPKDRVVALSYKQEIFDKINIPDVEEVYWSIENRYLIVIIDETVNLRDIKPNFEIMEQVLDDYDNIRGLVVSKEGVDVIETRFFDPWEGIDEDPVTGSAHVAMADYWFRKLRKQEFQGKQLSERGGSMIVRANDEFVTIIGESTLIMEGTILAGEYGNKSRKV